MKYRESIFTQRLFLHNTYHFLNTRNSSPHSEYLFSKILTIAIPSNFLVHATTIVSDHLDLKFSLPHSGHFARPGKLCITITRPLALKSSCVQESARSEHTKVA